MPRRCDGRGDGDGGEERDWMVDGNGGTNQKDLSARTMVTISNQAAPQIPLLERIGSPRMNPRWSTVRVRTFSARRIDQQRCPQSQCGSQVPEPHDTCPCFSLVPTTYTIVELLRVTRLKRDSSTSPYISIPVVMRDQCEVQGSRKSHWYRLAATLVYGTPLGLPSIKRLLSTSGL
jgi:hypothetical protein